MARTDGLRRQHDAAMAIVEQIVDLIHAPAGIATRSAAIDATMLLARLTGLLRIHFAQEDRVLYPELMASGDATTAATARRFFTEMGTVGPLYMKYAQQWASADAVLADRAGFREASEGIFDALARRISQENEELYRLADEAGASWRAA